MKFTSLFCYLLLFTIGFLPAQAANETVVFGPQKFTRTQGQPNKFTASFTATPGAATVTITNGDATGGHRVSSASVTLNGKTLCGPSSFGHDGKEIKFKVDLLSSNSLTVTLAGTPGGFLTVRVAQPDPVLVTGVVRDRNTHQPIANASVYFAGSDGYSGGIVATDASGRYRFKLADFNVSEVGGGGVAGTFYVGATGYFAAQPVTLADLASQPSLPVVQDYTLQPGGTVIRGRVVDAATGQGIAGAKVKLQWSWMRTFEPETRGQVYTQADGSFAIDSFSFYESGLTTGFVDSLSVEAPGYLGTTQSLSFTSYPLILDIQL